MSEELKNVREKTLKHYIETRGSQMHSSTYAKYIVVFCIYIVYK